jgi:RNA polymerase sigma-70 factor (ECF subfamily)
MRVPFRELTGALPYAAADPSTKASAAEAEVMSLFEEFRSPLMRYALSFGISVHDAEEVVQEVFLSLFRHLQAHGSRRNLRGWIFTVTHHLALKQRRENQRMRDKVEYVDSAELHRDTSPNPEQLVHIAQRQSRLLAVVNALPETDQRCLQLRAEGLRYREISAVLGISLGSVSISLTRSIARLTRAERS